MRTSNAFNVLPEIPSSSQTSCQLTAPLNGLNTILQCNHDSICSHSDVATPMLSNESKTGYLRIHLHIQGTTYCKLKYKTFIPGIDELGIAMAKENKPDIIGICETSFEPKHIL